MLFTIVGHEVRIVLGNKKKADAIIQAREKTVITTYFDALILCKADGTGGTGGILANKLTFLQPDYAH